MCCRGFENGETGGNVERMKRGRTVELDGDEKEVVVPCFFCFCSYSASDGSARLAGWLAGYSCLSLAMESR